MKLYASCSVKKIHMGSRVLWVLVQERCVIRRKKNLAVHRPQTDATRLPCSCKTVFTRPIIILCNVITLTKWLVKVPQHTEFSFNILIVWCRLKTKIVDTDRCKKTSDITVHGETVECLENFEYLGSKMEGNGKCSNEIKRRTAMAAGQLKKMEKIWKGQDKQTKLKIVRACIFPTAIYGCEGWTLTTADEKKINAFETKCYRMILRIPWIAKRKKTQKS